MLPANLRTARLMLRPPQDDDAQWIAREIARPEVHQMLTSPPRPYGLSDAQAWLLTATTQSGTFVIVADGPVGVIAVDRDRDGNELGYWLRTDAWGRGYMTEAALCLAAAWFGECDADLVSGHLVGNAASAGVLRKLGFVHEALMLRYSGFWAREVEVQRMRLTKADWVARAGDEVSR